MHLVPKCHITVGSLKFEWSHELEVVSSWKMLTDTAMIKLPANIKFDEGVDKGDSLRTITDHIPFGAEVKIQLSANGDPETIFEGFVTEVISKVPIVLKCEDQMFKLKQGPVSDSGKDQKLKGLLSKHFSGIDTNAIDMELGNYEIDNITQAQILKQIQSDFGVYSFFRNGKLTVGKQYDSSTEKVHIYDLDKDIIEESLEYKTADQIKVSVLATSEQPDGEKVEVKVGDTGGEQRTLNYYNLPEAELKASAESELERYVYDGWRGDITVLGLQIVKHGDLVRLKYKSENVDKSSDYYVTQVTSTFGVGGFRQKIELGIRK